MFRDKSLATPCIKRGEETPLIMVTGASGLLGANFLLCAHDRSLEVIAVSHRHAIRLEGVTSVQADLTDRAAFRELISRFKPAWIVHCAAATDVDWCEEHPLEAKLVNVEMSRILAVEAGRIGAKMVYISTDSIFDGATGNYEEEDTPAPLNVYAQSKLDGEKAVLAELQGVLIIRTNIYGWNAQNKLSLAEWILSGLGSDQPVLGFVDVMFTPILVNHLSEIILDMMERSFKGIYHVAGSQSCSKYQFATEVAHVFGYNKNLVQPVSVTSIGLRARRPVNPTLKTDKVREALDISLPDVRSGLVQFKSLRDSGFVSKLKGLLKEKVLDQPQNGPAVG